MNFVSPALRSAVRTRAAPSRAFSTRISPQVVTPRVVSRTHQAGFQRGYATESPKEDPEEAPKESSSSSTGVWITAGLAGALGAAYYFYAGSDGSLGASSKPLDYQEVYKAVADVLEENAEEYDDGSYAPVILRLAWHASGTYDKNSGSGGSNGATMRFAPESDHGANAGLIAAREKLDPIKAKFPKITYSDLWTLAGVCAIQEMGGPKVPWRPGRKDGLAENCTPDGRLPDGDKGPKHVRDIFYRMGFNDQEIVALIGAHALGRCHKDRSGFDGPWTFSPTMFTNDFYKLLFDEKWNFRKWDGPIQYEDTKTKSLMMLTTDMAMVEDKSFKQYAKKYAQDEQAFFNDFSKAFSKLLELGVPEVNWAGASPGYLKTVDEMEESKK